MVVDLTLERLRAWLAAPIPAVYAVAALVGLFVAGRLAARRRRLSNIGVYVLAGLGAVAAGTIAGTIRVALHPNGPPIALLAWAHEAWNPLTQAALPSLALAACFLLVGWQRERWWQATQLALGLDRPRGEPSRAEG